MTTGTVENAIGRREDGIAAHGKIWAAAALLVVVLGCLLATSSPALASSGSAHPEQETVFGPNGMPQSEENTFWPGTSEEISFDQHARRLYLFRPNLRTNSDGTPVMPQPPRGIFAFDLSSPGVYAPLSGNFPLPVARPSLIDQRVNLGVDESEGNVYYLESIYGNPNRILYSWDREGKMRSGFPKELQLPGGFNNNSASIAVDPLGYIWIVRSFLESTEPFTFAVRALKYDPNGVLIESFPLPVSLAADGVESFDPVTGDMWIRQFGQATKFTAQSGYRSHEAPIPFAGNENGGPIAVDGEHHTLYSPALFGNALLAYTESGDLIQETGVGGHSGNTLRPNRDAEAVTVDDASGALYVIDDSARFDGTALSGNIGVWPGVPTPGVESAPASAVGHTEATFNGHVEPDGGGAVTDCRFEYVTEADYQHTYRVSVRHATGGTFTLEESEIPYNATATEVQAATGGTVSGPAGGPWRIELSGQGEGMIVRYNDLTPLAAEVEVDWAAQTVPCLPSASPGSPIEASTDVSANVAGLTPGTTYRYRLSASNANGRNLSTDRVFTVNPTVVSTGAATEVEHNSARLNGTEDPENLATTYHFEYGTSPEYGDESASGELSAVEAGEKPVGIPISGLSPSTTYHYRIVAVNSNGTSVGVDRSFTTLPAVKGVSTEAATQIHRSDATLHGTLDPDGLQSTYYFEWGKTRRYGSVSAPPPGTDAGTTTPGEVSFSALAGGLQPESTYHFRIVAVNSRGATYGEDRIFTTEKAVKDLSTGPATDIGTSVATLNGSLDPDGYATTFYFQWGKTTSYGHNTPPPPGEDVGTTAPGSHAVSRMLENLEPGTTYHFRIVASNSFGTTVGQDQSFQTPQPPSVEGFFSSRVTATGAELTARINPHGYSTSYRFEYGTTTNYGSVAPLPDGSLEPLTSAQSVSTLLDGLQGVTYHFRVIAESQWGTTITEDETFQFNPPACPNASLRQQTGSAYLPDCRAYELVSPGRAGGAALLSEGPSSPLATSRFAFAAQFNIIPGTGRPPNGGFYPFTAPDLYVAHRTNTGWVTRYVGLSGEEALAQSGKPASNGASKLDQVLASGDLGELLTWKMTAPPNSAITEAASFAPYAWSYDGSYLGRLPTNFAEVPEAGKKPLEGGFLGDIRPSDDFTHYVFSAVRTAFAPAGTANQPGSVYDDDLATGSVQVVSETPSGADIPLDPLSSEPPTQYGSVQFLRIPAVSTDGSHILISSKAANGVHLYMRVDDAVTYEVSLGRDGQNHGVQFAGMSADGSEVFFTTAVALSADDHDSSIDLYRWSENDGAPTLARISVGAEGAIGDTDECNAGWIEACGVEVVPTSGNASSSHDTAVGADGGYVYFYSPEQLAPGARGVSGQRNLYLWHANSVRFVATIEPNPIEHINVSNDGSHMGLITQSQLTAYDNAKHAEMYVFDAASGALHCVSCRPDGEPPSADVQGAQNGIFMTDDGRAFFSTTEALVPRDANGIVDVYEYVQGRAQLIGSGAGSESESYDQHPGLIGVSANGANAFFFTTQTLVPQDENGFFFKVYDARTGGGIPHPEPAAPCAAADECHGVGSSSPQAPQIGSGADLGTLGNVAGKGRKHRRHKARHRKHGRRHGKHSGGHHKHRHRNARPLRGPR
jgi:hypothetical protein